MIKADKYLKETIQDILDNGSWDKDPRPKWKDGSPAYSKFITQAVFKYDINKGEFPITTLRKTALKGALGEILTIYRDQSNKKEDFERNSVFWWEDWFNEKDNLGTAYAWNLEPYSNSRDVVKVKRKFKKVTKLQQNHFFKNVYSESDNNRISNKEIKGKYCRFRVLEKTNVNPPRFKVQLLDTGEVREVSYTQIRYKNIKSNYYKSIHNTGFYGNYKRFSWLGEKTILSLKNKWTQMFERCFSDNKKLSNWNPEMIDERWHSFENFVEDCIKIPQFFTAKRDNFKGWILDKDYYGANFYSKDTCVFIAYKDNELYSEENNVYFVKGKWFLSIQDLSNEMGMKYGRMQHILTYHNLSGRNQEIKDNITIIKNNNPEYLYRFKISKNQVYSLLHSLEYNPFSRRHTMSFYNWEHQEDKELVECAFQTLWSVREQKETEISFYRHAYKSDIVRYIDLTLTQRSQDFMMTASINPAQYVMLGMMVCGHLTYTTGITHKLGNFLHLVQNCHIYDRHIDSAKELLERESIDEQPIIRLKENKNFYDYTIDDFEFNIPKGIKKLNRKLELAV